MKAGKIIRIFDEQRAIVNLGSEDGVRTGMRFGIYTPVVEIIDPDTGDRLGEYRQRKAAVRAQEVFARFSILTPPPEREHVVEQPPGMLGALMGARRSTRTIPGELPLDPGSAEPLPTGTTVRVGDMVEVFPIDDPDRGDNPDRSPEPPPASATP